MTAHPPVLVSTLLCALSLACFAPTASPNGPPARELRLADAQGARWPLRATPRVPHLSFALEDGVPTALPSPLWLLRNPATEALDDLLDGRLRAATEERLTPLRPVDSARHPPARALPEAPLAPGERYVVAWLSTPGELEQRELVVSPSPQAGATLRASLPADGSLGVSPAVAWLLLQYDGELHGGAVSLRADVEETLGGDVLRDACVAHGMARGTCVWVHPQSPLAPVTSHTLELSGALDATGARLPTTRVRFTTATHQTAAVLRALPCAPDEAQTASGCLRVEDRALVLRGEVHPPALVSLGAGGFSRTQIASRGAFALRVTGLSPGATLPLELQIRSPDDSLLRSSGTARLEQALPPVTIVAVRADPIGAEPAQEYVELLNSGSFPVSLMGFSLGQSSASSPGVLTDATALAPGERALWVGPDFDAEGPGDAPVPAGLRLLRADRAPRLPNTGSEVALWDADGRRLATAPASPAPEPGRCLVRRDLDALDLRDPSEHAWALRDCSPGAP